MAKLMSGGQLVRAVTGGTGQSRLSYLVRDPGISPRDWNDAAGSVPLASVWRAQPAVRTVVDFIARAVATIPLHVYRRNRDGGRSRVRDGLVAAALACPSPHRGQDPYRFWYRVLVDLLIYDRWAVAVLMDRDRPELVRIPPRRFRLKTDALDRVTGVELLGGHRPREVDPSGYLLDVGYSQESGAGTSPISALADILLEGQDAGEYRRRAFQRGAQHTGVVQRTEEWRSVDDRNRFLESLREFEATASRAGATMLLDDGMEWRDRKLDLEVLSDASARQLTTIEVASAYHVPPELLGLREGNYSNIESLRQSLYRDNLAAEISAWEQAVGALVGMLQPDEDLYVEAHVDSKLRGAFEEQAKTLQTATGGPWLTRNEARARQNLPAVEGGDELIIPLNVMVGGQASPTDSGRQNRASAPAPGSKSPPDILCKSADLEKDWHTTAEETLRRFFDRQSRSILPKLGAKADWWDEDRWNRELAADMTSLAGEAVLDMGRAALKGMGIDPDKWDQPSVLAYLAAICRARAQWVNNATRDQLSQALAAGQSPEEVFQAAKKSRAKAWAGAWIAALAGFAAIEAGKKHAPSGAVKIWHTRSIRPRPAHAAMNGVSAPLREPFPNGMQWPGDPAGGVEQVAGCRCGVVIETTPG